MEQNTESQATNPTNGGSADVKPFPVSGQAAPAPSGSAKTQQADSNADTDTAAAPGVDGLIKRAAQRAHEAVDGVAARLSSTVDGLQGSVSKAGDTRDEWLESAREAIRQHPFAAVAGALVIGAALSSLSSSR